ncbi:MAG: PHP domain-containing protein [Eubacteriales bacterium]|nr:PHP domain-containing protein [Eubacteriales bacterium]
MQNFNFHTHTKRCGHARGEDREYIEAAIAGGFTYLGISDHMCFPGWDDPVERMPYAAMDEYLDAVRGYQAEYRDRIEISLGFELEFFDDMVSYYREVAERVDYFIIGQHAKNRQDYYYDHHCTSEDLRVMHGQLIRAIETLRPFCIAHPDYFMQGRDECGEDVLAVMRDVAACCKAYDVPVEWNLKGAQMRPRKFKEGRTRAYPHRAIWEEIARVAPPVVIGYDAHYPEMLTKRELEMAAREELAALGLTPISTLPGGD